MISRVVILVVAATLFSCTHANRARFSNEPRDPTEEELAAQAKAAAQAAELAAMLKNAVIHFEFDDSTLSEQSRDTLATLAVALRANPWATIRVAGHCDERGTEEYNMALGQRRADAARKFLLAMGVPNDTVETVSFGAEIPAVSESNEAAWAENRRAEFGARPMELFGMAASEATR